MASQEQKRIWTAARARGAGGQGTALGDGACAYLLAGMVGDLDLEADFPELPRSVADFFGDVPAQELTIENDDPYSIYDRLVSSVVDADTFFKCLAKLHKARIKYGSILETQPFPTIEQVGPRVLLQYGAMNADHLTALLFWRKWLYDLDNRAAQETGYLFEPIIASAVGGEPLSSRQSGVWRGGDEARGGRQVDCYVERGKERLAYEIKLRVTIAASGQGRWGEELEFPADCEASGVRPVLIVFDGTPNPKLDELVRAFHAAGGTSYVGQRAWRHLEVEAGPVMARFLDEYVRRPMQALVAQDDVVLPDLTLSHSERTVRFQVGGSVLEIERRPPIEGEIEEDGTHAGT